MKNSLLFFALISFSLAYGNKPESFSKRTLEEMYEQTKNPTSNYFDKYSQVERARIKTHIQMALGAGNEKRSILPTTAWAAASFLLFVFTLNGISVSVYESLQGGIFLGAMVTGLAASAVKTMSAYQRYNKRTKKLGKLEYIQRFLTSYDS